MSGSANNPLSKVVSRIFPKVPDFYAMLSDQSALAVKSAQALVTYTETGNEEFAELVRSLEHEADDVKDRNLSALNEAFSTPMDREDLYRAIQTIDHVLNYAKTTVREMQVLNVEADDALREMAGILQEGVEALDAGYRALATSPAAAEPYAAAARKAGATCIRRCSANVFSVGFELDYSLTNDAPGKGTAVRDALASAFGSDATVTWGGRQADGIVITFA